MEFLESSKFKVITNIFIIILLIGLTVLSIINFIYKNNSNDKSNHSDVVAIKEDSNKELEEVVEEVKEESKQYVDIKGAIKKPGVYKVNKDMIINDVIKLAGGLKSNASTKYVNLSKKVSDQMVIYIYTINQVKKLNIVSNESCVVETEDISKCEGSSIIETKPSNNDSSTSIDKDNNSNNNQTISKININTAGIEELITLSGIGEAKAKSIIEYRESNGNFKSIEDIMNVSGIGEAAYNKIKDNITV